MATTTTPTPNPDPRFWMRFDYNGREVIGVPYAVKTTYWVVGESMCAGCPVRNTSKCGSSVPSSNPWACGPHRNGSTKIGVIWQYTDAWVARRLEGGTRHAAS